jgi:hypothetical protein
MQQFDAQRLTALDTAVRHDRLVLRRHGITQAAEQGAPTLHRETDQAAKQAYLESVLADAAEYAYPAETIALLYNSTLWAKRHFYREAPYAALFGQGLLSHKQRSEWLYTMLQLEKAQSLPEQPWFAGLQQDPLDTRLPRIRQAQAAHAYYQQQESAGEQLKTAYLALEYRALLIALLTDVSGQHCKHWQALEPEQEIMLDIENPVLQRRLRLGIYLGGHNHVAEAEGQPPILALYLGETLSRANLHHFQQCLGAYMLEQENISAIQAIPQTPPDKENEDA